MSDLLSRLRTPSEVHSVDETETGFNIIAKPDCLADFSLLVREAINCPNAPFVVFATLVPGTTEGHYERAHILPL
ncbi:MAG: hypothetical protein WC563_05965 [Brevundimonas sp.]|jgi:hypothetical protein